MQHRETAETGDAIACRDLLDIVDCAVVVIAPDGCVVRINRAAGRLLGCRRDEAVGAVAGELLCARSPDDALARRVRDAFAGVGPSGLACRIGDREVMWTLSLARDDDGAPHRLVAVGVDLTDGIAAPRDRWLSELGALAAMVVHDVGGPLTSSLLAASLLETRLQRAGADEPMRRLARSAVAGIDRAIEIVHEFRAAARGAAGRPLLPIDLLALAREALDLVRELAQARGVDVSLDVLAAGPVVRGARDELLRVLDNLLRNAIEAAGAGGDVALSVGEDGDRAVVAVRDDGPGIPADLDPFEAFTTTKPAGTGLGLAIAAHFVRAHGGELALERGVPRGTVARLWLPLATGERG